MSNPKVEIEKVKPRYHAEVCPVCKGKGKLVIFGDETKECHGCKGKGWIFVPNFPKERRGAG